MPYVIRFSDGVYNRGNGFEAADISDATQYATVEAVESALHDIGCGDSEIVDVAADPRGAVIEEVAADPRDRALELCVIALTHAHMSPESPEAVQCQETAIAAARSALRARAR